ncbi:hypothetical protein B0H19DRAFT_1079178 [Mycena capillaripes]|nr:hypothetical protein B0H19DRAFT_1079178 [Mycena capillaripes]
MAIEVHRSRGLHPQNPAYICTYVTYPRIPAVQLPYPLAVHSRNARPPVRPTRGPDIDDGGRRANSDMELVLSDKDMLPTYDGLDRPPSTAQSVFDMLKVLLGDSSYLIKVYLLTGQQLLLRAFNAQNFGER